ncbi:MAG: 30S ribosomal protein S9 [Thiotrichales bacterium]|nr:MAG: 30S ribosomal protein S9 [Thiotrichales bacterium]
MSTSSTEVKDGAGEAKVAKSQAKKSANGVECQGTGRRKSSVARVYLRKGSGNIEVNGKPVAEYFPQEVTRTILVQALHADGVDAANDYDIKVNVNGGGISGQAGAIRLGIARALSSLSEDSRVILRKLGLLTRDSRKVERKKFGFRKSRKKEQYSKR